MGERRPMAGPGRTRCFYDDSSVKNDRVIADHPSRRWLSRDVGLLAFGSSSEVEA
jgi:hypothetical protein